MTNSIFDRFSSTDTASVQRKQRKQKQGRILRIEELENRELLSATPWNMAALMPSSSSSSWDDSTDANTQVIVSSASASASAASSPVLEAPAGLTAADVTFDSITLEWNAVEGATSYEIQYCIRFSGEWVLVTDIADTSVTLIDLRADVEYVIQVRAVAEDRMSLWSQSVLLGTPPIPAPTGLTVLDVTFGSITVQWDEVSGVEEYRVGFSALDGYGTSSAQVTYITETSAIITGLRAGVEYNISVQVASKNSWFHASSSVRATTPAIPIPTGLTVTDRTHQSIAVEWNEVSDAAGYELRYSVYDLWSSRREWTVVSDITDATFTINGLQSRTSYEIQVCAVAEGTFSNWRYVIAHTTYFVPTPTDLSVSVGEMSNHIFDRSAMLTWNAGEGSTALNSIVYVVECREYGTDAWNSRSGRIALAATWTSLMPGSTYEFRVRAESAGVSSEWSDSVLVTIPATTAPSTTVTQSWGGSIAVVGSTLEIQGTDYSDWIEIQQTSTSIIVHSFCEQRIDRTGVWSFDVAGLTQIAFWGFGGNDTFIGAYEGVSTTIALRLDGGGGDNWLVGGAGNDWIYGGWLGNSHLDTGVAGDSIVIGGRDDTVFYNNSASSDMFIGAGTYDVWADGHSLGSTDGQLRMDMSGGTGQDGFVFRAWSEAEVLGIVEYVSQTYDILGTYRFFTSTPGLIPHRPVRGITCHISIAQGLAEAYAIPSEGRIAFYEMPSYSTFVHEVAHLWQDQNRNPIWNDFRSISWDGSEQYEEDFVDWYGMRNVREDWATTLEYVVAGYAYNWFVGSSDKWHQKVDMVHQFFAWLNPNYVRQSDTPDVPGAVDESTDEPSVDIPPVEEPIEEEPPVEEEPIDIPVAPSAPTDMRIEESSPYSVVLQWTQSDEVSSYVLEYIRTSDTEGEWIEITAPVAGATSVRIEGLKPVTQYTFRLTAVNEAGTAATEMTATTTANPDALFPVKPRVRLDKKATTTTSLTINLLAPNSRTSLDANVHYTISWSPTARNSTAPSGYVEGVTGTQFTLTDLNPGTRYRITVTPHNENGQSHDSRNRSMHTTINATTQRYDTLRVQKLRSDNSLRTADSLTFTWQQSRAKHVADAVIHYRIEVLDRTTGQTVMQTTTTDLRFTMTELEANTRYTIRVQEVATIDGRDILSRIAQLTARTLRLV